MSRDGMWWYAHGMKEGKYFVLGPFADEDEAMKDGYYNIGGLFERTALPTRALATATRILKARKLRETGDLSESTKNMYHQRVERF